MILGPKECKPIVEIYRSKRRGHTRSALDPTRTTPRFLGVIATPDEKREGWKRDSTLLRWDVVRGYLSSTADTRFGP